MERERVFYSEKPAFLYKSPDALREDISRIRETIGEVKRSFSIRELLLGMANDGIERRPSEWIYDLEAMLGEAESAYRRLTELREELSFLEEELSEARCRIKL